MSVYAKLEQLGIELAEISVPVAAYVPFVQSGDLIFTSGHIAKTASGVLAGKFGLNMDTAQGKLAAREIAINLISTLNAATKNNLNAIERIIKLTVLVNCNESFTEQHLIADGASELLQQVFGQPHSRCAYGVAQIPLGSCLEIDLVAQVKTS